MDANDLTTAVQNRYASAARAARAGRSACCGDTCGCDDPITAGLYDGDQTRDLPEAAVAASLGCGNPTALADLKPGQTVLDLGSGGGIDVLLSARRVGPSGFVFGLDMTDEMLALARENQAKAGVQNVTFLKGTIDAIPLPAGSVDVVISNCVINLAHDKDRVLQEAFRVLKPGGLFAVSDVVVTADVPPEVRRSMELWVGCIAGALHERDYVQKLVAAGFEQPTVERWRVYHPKDAAAFLGYAGLSDDAIRSAEGAFASAFIRAVKPGTCCTSSCCGRD